MEKKKLLLVFIHGFKGDGTTFLSFPTYLSAELSLALPHLTIEALVYPVFETRGDLAATVRRFTDWLTTTVIDKEVARGTKSPMVDEGVRVVVVGHSMGGMVGAECLLGLVAELGNSGGKSLNDMDVEGEEEVKKGKEDARRRWEREGTPGVGDGRELPREPHMFPYVQGLLAFDTPYLGISPGVVAHGAEGHWNTGKALYDSAAGVYAAVQGIRGFGGKDQEAQRRTKGMEAGANAPIPPPPSASPAAAGKPATPASSSSPWSRYALYGLGASAVTLAAGTTAYLARSSLSSGYAWATSHLEFVGCLGRPEELRKRFAAVVGLSGASTAEQKHVAMPRQPFVGFVNFYTLLGKGATPLQEEQTVAGSTFSSYLSANMPKPPRNEWAEGVLGPERTFCNVPKQGRAGVTHGRASAKAADGVWRAALNDLAPDEVSAHQAMFNPELNLGYYAMAEEARDLIVDWVGCGGWGDE